jgi:hypothetical protein
MMPLRLNFPILEVDVPRGYEEEMLVSEMGGLPVKVG